MAVSASSRASYGQQLHLHIIAGRLDENQEGTFCEAMLVRTRAASNCRSGRLMSCKNMTKCGNDTCRNHLLNWWRERGSFVANVSPLHQEEMRAGHSQVYDDKLGLSEKAVP